jgi:hypothetical protein
MLIYPYLKNTSLLSNHKDEMVLLIQNPVHLDKNVK